MNRRPLASIGVLAIVVGVAWLAPRPAEGQQGSPSRTAWGDPDLQGVWDYRTVTPMERPEALEDREFLTAEEAAELEQQAVERQVDRPPRAGDPGTYNQFWMDFGTNIVGTRHPAPGARRSSSIRRTGESPTWRRRRSAGRRRWPRRAKAWATTCRGPEPGSRTCR